tara:strand:- start:535 stop:1566 length:1032 start_codon:yes stop_codon:yes gene_type:complete
MKYLFDDLKKKLRLLKKSNKKKVFYFGNTAKLEISKFYLTDIRESRNFIYFGAVVYNDEITKKIAKIIDGKVDFALVDLEKKLLSKKKKEIVNIERSVKDTLKQTKLFTYKGNDLAVQACETLINNLFMDDIRGIGGKKILILGAGNIGFKLGMKFVESGAEVYLYRRKKSILKKLSKTINLILPKGTLAKCHTINNFKKNLSKFDIIIGSTNGKPLIDINDLKKIEKKIIIDVGKGILKKNVLKKNTSKNYNIFRLDVGPAYDGYLENLHTTEKIYNKNELKTKNVGKYLLVKRGILSREGSLIVDNVIKPKFFFGIADGNGGFKKINKKKIQLLKKKFLKN